MKTILYCRKSSEADDRQALSLESQTTEMTASAIKRGIKIDKVFTESMSAKAPGRPFFNEMIKYISKHKEVAVLTWKLDRLARNPIDYGQISWLLQTGIITEIITHEKSYFPYDNILAMSVESAMANQYIRDLSANVKRGNKTKLEKGGWTGKTPFGYLNNQLDKSVIVDPVRSPHICKIFRMFATGGYSLKDLSKKLYYEGLRTKSGKKIHASLLYRMITNPFYIGIMVRGGKHYQGNHEPLVSNELFQSCGRVLSGNRSKKQKHLFPFRGFMSCSECGCMITASIRRGHRYYHCTNGKRLHTAKREHFRSEVLNQEVAAKLQELQFDEEQVEIMYQAALEENQTDSQLLEATKQNITTQLQTLSQRRERLEDTYLDGTMTKDRYEVRILDLDNQEIDFQNQLKELERKYSEHSNATIGQTKKAFLTAIYAEKDFLCGNDFKKRELVEILLSDMTIKNQKVQQIQFKPAYQRMYLSPKKLDFSLWSG